MMAILGKMCVTATFAIIYLYSCELFPTVVRSVGVSSSSVFARVGGAVAPFVGSLDKVFAIVGKVIQSEATKRNPEMGKTAIQPEPAQTADLSISGLRLVAPPCNCPWYSILP